MFLGYDTCDTSHIHLISYNVLNDVISCKELKCTEYEVLGEAVETEVCFWIHCDRGEFTVKLKKADNTEVEVKVPFCQPKLIKGKYKSVKIHGLGTDIS